MLKVSCWTDSLHVFPARPPPMPSRSPATSGSAVGRVSWTSFPTKKRVLGNRTVSQTTMSKTMYYTSFVITTVWASFIHGLMLATQHVTITKTLRCHLARLLGHFVQRFGFTRWPNTAQLTHKRNTMTSELDTSSLWPLQNFSGNFCRWGEKRFSCWIQ